VRAGASTPIAYPMQTNRVDKFAPTVYNEDRAANVKVALRKWKDVGDGPTREKGEVTGGYDTVTRTVCSGSAGCDGDSSQRCREARAQTKRKGDA
jgi:hypothetical protein